MISERPNSQDDGGEGFDAELMCEGSEASGVDSAHPDLSAVKSLGHMTPHGL